MDALQHLLLSYQNASAVHRFATRCLLSALAFPAGCTTAAVVEGRAMPQLDNSLISIAVNIVLGVVIFYVGSKIRIAILELENRIADKYATKDEVEKQIDLVGRVDRIPGRTFELLRNTEGRTR